MQMIAIFNSLVLFKYVAYGERRSSGCKGKKNLWEMGFILCIYIAAIERQQQSQMNDNDCSFYRTTANGCILV